ncbi:MAG: hypothetical protein OXH75_20540 [Acidobacteria bacterium]|nr:hypothetical protein [Acidobacteriota bacterium]
MREFRKRQSVRRIVVGGAFAATLAAGVLLGGLLTSQPADAQPQVTFNGNAAIMFHFVKPASQSAYEGVMQRLSDALQRSEVAGRQDQARGWKVFKASQDFTGQGAVPYVWVIDPVQGGANYAAATILNEVFPGEIEQLFNTYNGSFTDGQVKQLPVNLQLVADF